KTTSFRMTTGQVVPNAGQVLFNGTDVTTRPMFQRARSGMGYLSQEPSIFRKLSVEKNLIAILEALPRSRSLGRKLSRRERWERTDAALARFNLTHIRKNAAARCSGGEKRRLEIARCLVCEPLLILLDEPFAAVDPLTKEDIRQNIRELANQGIGILLTDHDVREVLKITDRSYLIKDGRVIAHGTPSEIKRNPVAIEAYLGNTFADDAVPSILQDEFAAWRAARAAGTEPILLSQQPVATPAPAPIAVPLPIELPRAVEELATPINIAPEPVPDPEDDPPTPPLPPGGGGGSRPERAPAPNPTRIVTFAPPPPVTTGRFSAQAQALLEYERLRKLVDLFADDSRWSDAWHELSRQGLDAVPVLLEALERREPQIRHLSFRLLEQVTGERLEFDSGAPDDVRLRQAAQLRVRFERRRAS
ncbi:MAG: LPS export ABC transporter ATP-binding protein, partial [Gemmataceae bacterium]